MDVVMAAAAYGTYAPSTYCAVYPAVVNVESPGTGPPYFGAKVILEDDVVNKID